MRDDLNTDSFDVIGD